MEFSTVMVIFVMSLFGTGKICVALFTLLSLPMLLQATSVNSATLSSVNVVFLFMVFYTEAG
jgi:hypothetical protein